MLEIKKAPSQPQDGSIRLQAIDAGQDAGEITFRIAERTAQVESIRFSDEMIGEGLLRSAFFLAAEQGALYASCQLKELEPLLLKLHFTAQQNKYTANIVDIFKKCANCQS